MKKTTLMAVCAGALCVQACISPEQLESAHKVITALPTEVEGCTFLGNVDTHSAYAAVENARFYLQMETAQLGGTHLVELYAYPARLTRHFYGVALSGRAYKCPLGKGPILPNDDAHVKSDFPTDPDLFGDRKVLKVGGPAKETGAPKDL